MKTLDVPVTYLSSRPLHGQDKVFRNIQPGEVSEFRLRFSKAAMFERVRTDDIQILNGVLYLYSESGYFRISASGRMYAKPEPDADERELDVVAPHVWINSEAMGVSAVGPPFEYRVQPLTIVSKQAEYTVTSVRVECSDDFDGHIGGWKVAGGK